jgi:hypothetical protein
MQIIRSSIDTQKGPADWFTGDVYIDDAGHVGAEVLGDLHGKRAHASPGAHD